MSLLLLRGRSLVDDLRRSATEAATEDWRLLRLRERLCVVSDSDVFRFLFLGDRLSPESILTVLVSALGVGT